jgi:hypothetical protein
MARIIEEETICLHEEDAISSKLWMDRLEADKTCTFYKDKSNPPPFGSNLDKEVFVMCIQTSFQVGVFGHLSNGFIGIDATHNITQYANFLLFTIIVRDQWARGVLLLQHAINLVLILSNQVFQWLGCLCLTEPRR